MFLLVVVVIAAIVVVAVVVVAAGGGDGVLFVVSAFCDFLASPLVMVRQGVAWFGQPLCVLTGGAPQLKACRISLDSMCILQNGSFDTYCTKPMGLRIGLSLQFRS